MFSVVVGHPPSRLPQAPVRLKGVHEELAFATARAHLFDATNECGRSRSNSVPVLECEPVSSVASKLVHVSVEIAEEALACAGFEYLCCYIRKGLFCGLK